MRRSALIVLLLSLTASRVCAAIGDASLTARLSADPYDYRSRQQLVQLLQRSGDDPTAYYHAAWLAWLASRSYAESAAGAPFLRDRRARDRAAAWSGATSLAAVVAEVDVTRSVADTCLNGTLPSQATRLRADVAETLARAEQADAGAGRADPVARTALARLYLLLDDCVVFEGAPDSLRTRARVLQKAASLASAVTEWLPKSPGAFRLLATARARLAELENRQEYWDMALDAAKMAQALDPFDESLSEMVWTLQLRAGRWAEAKRWEGGGPGDGAPNVSANSHKRRRAR